VWEREAAYQSICITAQSSSCMAGRIVRTTMYVDPAQVLEAAGLSE
jgi:hypothetical protein